MKLKLDSLKIDGIRSDRETNALRRIRKLLNNLPDEEFLTASGVATVGKFSQSTVVAHRSVLVADGLCQPSGDARGRVLHGNKRSIAALKELQGSQL